MLLPPPSPPAFLDDDLHDDDEDDDDFPPFNNQPEDDDDQPQDPFYDELVENEFPCLDDNESELQDILGSGQDGDGPMMRAEEQHSNQMETTR